MPSLESGLLEAHLFNDLARSIVFDIVFDVLSLKKGLQAARGTRATDEEPVKAANPAHQQVTCPNCGNGTAPARFVMHLVKCLKLPRATSRRGPPPPSHSSDYKGNMGAATPERARNNTATASKNTASAAQDSLINGSSQEKRKHASAHDTSASPPKSRH